MEVTFMGFDQKTVQPNWVGFNDFRPSSNTVTSLIIEGVFGITESTKNNELT